MKRRVRNWAVPIMTAASAVVVCLKTLEQRSIEGISLGWLASSSGDSTLTRHPLGLRMSLGQIATADKSGGDGEAFGLRHLPRGPSSEQQPEKDRGMDGVGDRVDRNLDPEKSQKVRRLPDEAGKREGTGFVPLSNSAPNSANSKLGGAPSTPSNQNHRAKPTANELYRTKFGSQALNQLLLEQHRKDSFSAGPSLSDFGAMPNAKISETEHHFVASGNPVGIGSADQEPSATSTGLPAVLPMFTDASAVPPVFFEPIAPAWVPQPTTSIVPAIQIHRIAGRLFFQVTGSSLTGLQIQKMNAMDHSGWHCVHQFTEEKGISWSESPQGSSGFWRLKR